VPLSSIKVRKTLDTTWMWASGRDGYEQTREAAMAAWAVYS
jgi:hypothetical protein